MITRHFIHIPKTGGSAILTINDRLITKDEEKKHAYIEIFHVPGIQIHATDTNDLSDEYLTEWKASLVSPNLNPLVWKNKRGRGVEHSRWCDLLPTIQQHTFFSLVRNPWARVVSRWRFNDRKQRSIPQSKNWLPTFEQFLERLNDADTPFAWHQSVHGWSLQKDYVTDKQGNLHADILRTEHLQNDFSKYFDDQTTILPIVNQSETTVFDYRTAYDETTKRIVSNWYGDDIEFFGFSFDGPATKNII